MNIPFTFNQFPRLLRWSVIVIGIILLTALASWLILPSYLKSTLEQQVEAQTGRQFKVGAVQVNPFTLTVNLSQIQLMETDNKSAAFAADNLEIKASPASLLHVAPVIRAVTLTHPRLQLMRAHQDGKEITNFSDLIARLAQHPSTGEPLHFSVSNIQLLNGAIELDDHVAGKQVHIESLVLAVPFISNFRTALDVYVEPYLAASVDGSKFELKGRSKPFTESLDTNLAIDINQFKLGELMAFSPKPLPFKVKSASLSTHLNLNFSTQKNDQRISLSGTASLDNVALDDLNDAPLLALKQINLNLQDANLVNQHIGINVLELVEPQLWAGLDQHGLLNWLALNGRSAQANPPAATTGNATPVTLELAHLVLKDGTVHWSDAANASPALQLDLNRVEIDAQHLSTRENAEPAKLVASLGQEQHQRLQFDGTISPQTASVSGQLTVDDLAIETYQPYLNRLIDGSVIGTVAMKTRLELQGGNVGLSGLSASVDALRVKAKRSEFGGLSAKRIAIDNASLNTQTRQAKVEQLVLDQLQGDLFRTADGAVNVIHLMKKTGAPRQAPDHGKPAKSWQAEIDQIALNDSRFSFGDKAVQPAVMIRADAVNIKLNNVSSDMNRPVKLALRATLNKTGRFVVDGTASGKAMQLNVNVQNFAIMPLQPYFTQFLNISLEKGSVSTKGKLGWQAPAQLQFQGGLKLANFITSDKETSDDFLKWKLLDIGGININLGGSQPSVTLGKIDLNEFYARAILSEQGKLNLQDIVAHPAAAANDPGTVAGAPAPAIPPATGASTNSAAPGTTGAAAVAPVITIGAINLNSGTVNYTDNFIKPHYSMRMTGMSGNVGTIRSDLAQSAPIAINGKVDDEAPIAISGSLNPLFKPMLLDMKLTATGVDLPKLTTYALKYAGYPIVKGKLSLDVEYHIKDNQLSANNTLKIDQLTFGDKVDSPDATHLPVPFLVSLLTDANGQINLDLPISGTLNDPQFSIGGVIVRVLVNILEKVVTSPFSLLSHAFGANSEEMAYIEFDPGSSKLTDAAKTKLDSLAKALADRPQLKLDIIGRAALTTDDAGLRQHILDSQIKKSNSLEQESSEDASIAEADRARAIDRIYSAAKFDKPRNFIGFAKSLPTADMEKLILANTKISEDDIRALALRRESAVHVYLTDVAHVAPDRLFAIAPRLSADGIKDKGAISRVDFDLKM